ncbi:GNAT family N-acetyltransferase [Allorhizocola rhizosphaerae]|uniref:GNAT family N-acetyltransferase n=1 Tax=Allorhizocola rhizosphaerae TaxID=1872709 RepID=UPI001478575A|nr:GNAT family protein [Allorhizocola rhizosphaerae]
MTTQTMALRPLRFQDWEAVHEWARLEEACRFQPWGPDTPEETRSFVRGAVAAWDDGRYVHAAEIDGFVKGIGELRLGPHMQGEIAYGVHPELWGRGVGTGIARELLRIGFDELKLHRIWGTCDPRNVASGRVMQKLGMTCEGRMRHNLLIRDGWRDSDLYAILDHEWVAAASGVTQLDATD